MLLVPAELSVNTQREIVAVPPFKDIAPPCPACPAGFGLGKTGSSGHPHQEEGPVDEPAVFPEKREPDIETVESLAATAPPEAAAPGDNGKPVMHWPLEPPA